MLTPLSILSLDQGPKWREPDAAPLPETAAPAPERRPVGAVLHLVVAKLLAGRIALRAPGAGAKISAP
jgi:hypothetical protein